MIHNYIGQLKFIMIVLIHLDFFIYSRGFGSNINMQLKKSLMKQEIMEVLLIYLQ